MTKNIQKILAVASGATFLIVLLILAVAIPQPSPFQYIVFRIILALAAAGFAALIPGFLEISIKGWIRAGGALAVFIIVYFYNPAELLTQRNAERQSNNSQFFFNLPVFKIDRNVVVKSHLNTQTNIEYQSIQEPTSLSNIISTAHSDFKFGYTDPARRIFNEAQLNTFQQPQASPSGSPAMVNTVTDQPSLSLKETLALVKDFLIQTRQTKTLAIELKISIQSKTTQVRAASQILVKVYDALLDLLQNETEATVELREEELSFSAFLTKLAESNDTNVLFFEVETLVSNDLKLAVASSKMLEEQLRYVGEKALLESHFRLLSISKACLIDVDEAYRNACLTDESDLNRINLLKTRAKSQISTGTSLLAALSYYLDEKKNFGVGWNDLIRISLQGYVRELKQTQVNLQHIENVASEIGSLFEQLDQAKPVFALKMRRIAQILSDLTETTKERTQLENKNAVNRLKLIDEKSRQARATNQIIIFQE